MSKVRILWADDEIDLLKPHILFLQNKGYEVETVTNGRDAIDMLGSQIFNLIILDENMPGISGLEALQRIFGATVAYDSETSSVTVDTATKQLIQDGESFYNSHEIYWLSRIIYAEANGQPFDGMIGVGNVVLNRVASGRFPNTVEGVVFEPGQFTPVDNGSIYNTPSSEAVLAARDAHGCRCLVRPA